MKKTIFAIFATLILGLHPNLAHAADKQPVPIKFQVLEYNSVASKHLPRPTFVDAEIKNGVIKTLYIRADFITGSEYTSFTRGMELHWIKRKRLDNYIEGVEKFLKWEEIATRDGDAFTKEIGKFGKSIFTFHSGNSKRHFLEISKCSTCSDSAYYYNRDGAKGLLELLKAWQANELDPLSESELDDKYK